MANLSKSKKLARIVLNDPAVGEVIVQESPGYPNDKLRAAIGKAGEAFWAEYNDPKWVTKAGKK